VGVHKNPNIDLICRIGQKIEIDLVLLYSFLWGSQGHGWDTFIYIVDVKNKKIYSKNYSIDYSSVHYGIKAFTEKFFATYEKDHLY
jgi:hypothetical protein